MKSRKGEFYIACCNHGEIFLRKKTGHILDDGKNQYGICRGEDGLYRITDLTTGALMNIPEPGNYSVARTLLENCRNHKAKHSGLNKYCEETDEQKMTCKDCLKKELGYCKFDCTEPCKCLDFKHKSEWVHLPCKINDTFYYIGQYARNGRLTNDYCVCEGQVSSFEYGGVLTIYDLNGMDHSLGEIFLTIEEAEKALLEWSNG